MKSGDRQAHWRLQQAPFAKCRLPALVYQAGQILVAVWGRVDGPRGPGDKAVIGVEIHRLLRQQLPDLFFCDLWGDDTDCMLTLTPN